MQFRSLLLVILSLLLAACGSDDPQRTERDLKTDGQFSLNLAFDDESGIETGNFPGEGSLKVENGQYTIETQNPNGASYLWGEVMMPSMLKNVQIEVDAHSVSGADDNWYGVMCRLDENGNGIAFLVGSDGFWSIARSDGRGLTFLRNWKQSKHIKTGDATNHIRAYCLEDYMALYVNGEFIGDVETNDFDRTGVVALIAGGKEKSTVTIAFDNLSIESAQLGKTANTPAPPPPQPTATHTPPVLPTLPILPTIEIPPLGEPEPTPGASIFG